MPSLPPHEIHLWFVLSDEIEDPVLLRSYADLMNSEEQARYQRIIVQHARHQHLLARALVRTTLSRYAEVDPTAWAFCENEYGRPAIVPPTGAGCEQLRFNLSHTAGLIVCGVVQSLELGVDVEDTWRKRETVAIADRFFSEREVEALHALPRGRQQDRFFDYWTLKESYIKARGMGLSLPLGKFSFYPDRRPITIATDPSLEDDPDTWQFEQFSPTARHRAAVGVRRGKGEQDLRVVAWKVVPLAGEERWAVVPSC